MEEETLDLKDIDKLIEQIEPHENPKKTLKDIVIDRDIAVYLLIDKGYSVAQVRKVLNCSHALVTQSISYMGRAKRIDAELSKRGLKLSEI